MLRGILACLLAAAAAVASIYLANSHLRYPEWIGLLALPMAFGLVACVASPSRLTPPVFVAILYGIERLVVGAAVEPLDGTVSQKWIDGDWSALIVPVGIAVFGWVAIRVYRRIAGYGSKPDEPLQGSHLAGVLAMIAIVAGLGLMIGSKRPTGGLLLCLTAATPVLYWVSWQGATPPMSKNRQTVTYVGGFYLLFGCLWAVLFYMKDAFLTDEDGKLVVATLLFGIQVVTLERLRRRPRLLTGWVLGATAGVILLALGRWRLGWLGDNTWLIRAVGKPIYAVMGIGLIAGPLLGLLPAIYWRSQARAHQAREARWAD